MRLHTLERLQKAISKRIWYLCDYINYNRTEKVKFLDKIEELRSEVKQGDKLLIIGNGPSIKNTDITKYKDYKIVTMNRAYIKWEHLGLHDIFFHVCINQLVISEFAEDLSNLRCPTFLNYTASKAAAVTPKQNIAHILMGFFVGDRVIKSLDLPFSSGGTVTFVALNLGLLLGFKKIALIGVDHSFYNSGPANKTLTQEGDDRNHFFENYFPAGMQWELPDLQRSEQSFALIKKAAEDMGIEITDETVGGNLQVFKKIGPELEF